MILIYQFLTEHSSTERALELFEFDVPQDVETISIWRGFVKDIANAMNLKKHLVDQAITNLIYVESIRRIYRGSHGHPSIFLLIESPELNKYLQLQEKSHLTGRYHTLTPEQRMERSFNQLVNRVTAVEERLERLERAQNDAVRRPRW